VKALPGASLVVVLLTFGAWAAERPPAPDGFSWFAVPETKASFLRPDGWTAGVDRREGFVGYRFSSPGGGSVCSITVLPGSGPISDPAKRATDFVKGMQLVASLVGEQEGPSNLGPFHFAAGTFVEKNPPGSPHQSYTKIVVNPKTGTTYVIGFEALASAWDEAWKTGRVCTGLFAIDDQD